MYKLINTVMRAALFFLLVIGLISCSGGGSDPVGSSGGPVMGGAVGTLSLGLTDAPPPRNTYEAIYVTIQEIWVKNENKAGWDKLTGPDLNLPKTFNLLELVNGVVAHLGAVELEAGHYNQMRLLLGPEPDGELNVVGDEHHYANYLILAGEEEQIPLKVPSGFQTGIKLVNGFDIVAQGSTELLLDFDARKSVVQAGNSGKWILKPTIKVIESVVNSVRGIIYDENGIPLEDAMISAQLNTSLDDVEAVNETFSDMNGLYFMYLPLNGTSSPYNVVATATKTVDDTEIVYAPVCHQLESSEARAYIENFMLNIPESGVLSVIIDGLSDPSLSPIDSIALSIRQGHETCGLIEIKSTSWAYEGSPVNGDFTLPVGLYDIAASLYNNNELVDEIIEFDVDIPTTTELIFDFSVNP